MVCGEKRKSALRLAEKKKFAKRREGEKAMIMQVNLVPKEKKSRNARRGVREAASRPGGVE